MESYRSHVSLFEAACLTAEKKTEKGQVGIMNMRWGQCVSLCTPLSREYAIAKMAAVISLAG